MEGDDSLLMVSLDNNHTVHRILTGVSSTLCPSPLDVTETFQSQHIFGTQHVYNNIHGSDMPATPPYVVNDTTCNYMVNNNSIYHNALIREESVASPLNHNSSLIAGIKAESFDQSNQQQLALTIPSSNSDSNNGSLHSSPMSQPGICRPFLCPDCHKAFANNSALVKHRLIHSDERRFSCNLCNKSFKRQDHLTGHMNVHKDIKPFQCVISGCAKSYCDARSLKRHLEHGHHLPNAVVSSMKGVMYVRYGEKDEFKHTCKIETSPLSGNGHRTRNSSGNSSNSTDAAHSEISGGFSNSNTKEKGPVECSQCGRQFKNTPALNGHMRLHSAMHRERAIINSQRKHNNNNNTMANCLTTSDDYEVCDMHDLMSHHSTPDQIFTQATLPYICSSGEIYGSSELQPNYETATNQQLLGQYATDRVRIEHIDGHPNRDSILSSLLANDVTPHHSVIQLPMNTLSDMTHSPLDAITHSPLTSITHSHETSMQALTQDLGIELREVDDADIREELEALNNADPYSNQLNLLSNANSLQNDDLFSSSTRDWVGPCTNAVPLRRRHPTAPSALAPCRLDLSPQVESGTRRLSPGGTFSRLHPPKSRGKPENVCQILKKRTSPTSKTQGNFYSTGGKPRAGRASAAASRVKAKSGNSSRRVSTIDASSALSVAKQKASHLAPLNLQNLTRYPSQLRSPRLWDRTSSDSSGSSVGFLSPYTPPPILSPMRLGTGLFCTLTRQFTVPGNRKGSLHLNTARWNVLEPPKSAPLGGAFDRMNYNEPLPSLLELDMKTCTSYHINYDPLLQVDSCEKRSHSTYSPIQVDTTFENIPETDTTPHINVGNSFQAYVPDWMGRSEFSRYCANENEMADLLFHPNCVAKLDEQKVENYLRLACSSAVIGGGRNEELALHVLHNTGGNVQESIICLMDTNMLHKISVMDYCYVDNVFWSPMEIQTFYETLMCMVVKDFSKMAEKIAGKTMKQCVQFYYTWKKCFPDEYNKVKCSISAMKKKDNLDTCHNNELEVSAVNQYNLRSCMKEDAVFSVQESLPKAVASPNCFPCRICKKVFEKIKSRNAHMKTHNKRAKLD